MIIAAHIVLTKDEERNNLMNLLRIVAEKNTYYKFIFFVQKTKGMEFNIPSNAMVLPIRPSIHNKLALKLWYLYKLPRYLKKYNADVFISELGLRCTKSKLPQYFFLNAPRQLSNKSTNNSRLQYDHRKLFFKDADKTRCIFISASHLEQVYTSMQKETRVVPCFPGIPEVYQQRSWELKSKTLLQYSEEKEFFLFVVTNNTRSQLITMLKAFSLFKKWQRSDMKLLLLLHEVEWTDVVPQFDLYKHRHDVVIEQFKDHQHASELIAAAYMQIYFPENFADENYDLFGLQCAVALIVPDQDFMHSKLQNAACYAAQNEKSLSDNMMLLYKDEHLKNNLLRQAADVLKNYNSQQAAAVLEQEISR